MKTLSFLLTTFLMVVSTSGSMALAGKNDTIVKNKLPYTEKVYLHLDRQYFSSGDDIWFKAYLLNGRNNKPSLNGSKTLYAELISPDSKIIGRKVLHMDNASTIGDFKLSDSIAGGKFRIRAYTKWMLNFGSTFVFEKEIEVYSLASQKPKDTRLPVIDKIDIGFFPEGGSMVADVPTTVAMKATNVLGTGVDVRGKIISSKGDTVCSFESLSMGMGKFSFFPVNDLTYYAVGTSKNIPFHEMLPSVLAQGFVMRVTTADSMVTVNISTNEATFNEYKNKYITLTVLHSGVKVFKYPVKLNRVSQSFKIPKDFFAIGINQLTLTDSLQRPQAERLLYLEPKRKLNVSVTAGKSQYRTREATTLNIKVTDVNNRPVKANLSLAVTDAGMVPGNLFNIQSYLLLESELRGKVEKPTMYFDTTNADRMKQMDLLMLTQGWRDFIWKHEADSVFKAKYQVEQGLEVTGYVRRRFFKTPVKDANVTMLLFGAKKAGLRLAKTDSAGKFDLGDVEFYGQKRIILSSKKANGSDVGWIRLDSLYMRPMHNPVAVQFQYQIDSLATIRQYASESNRKNQILRKYKLSDTIELNDVRIGDFKYRNTKLEKIFTIKTEDTVYYDIDWYLRDHWPYLDGPFPKTFHIIGLKGIYWRYAAKIYDVHTLSMNEINKIDVYRGLGIQRDYFIIDVHVKPNAFEKPDFYSMNSEVNGYNVGRVFYAPARNNSYPQGKPDLRTTIQWAPNITTDENGEASVKYFNAEQTGPVRAVVEGISAGGNTIVGGTHYTVRGR